MDKDKMNAVQEDNGMDISVLVYRLGKKKKKIKRMEREMAKAETIARIEHIFWFVAGFGLCLILYSFCDSLVKLGR